MRKRFFALRPSFKTLQDLNDCLTKKCVAFAKSQAHTEQKAHTVFDAFEAGGRSSL